MKILNIPLDEKEHEELMRIKGDKTWREYLLTKCDGK